MEDGAQYIKKDNQYKILPIKMFQINLKSYKKKIQTTPLIYNRLNTSAFSASINTLANKGRIKEKGVVN